MPLSEKQGVGSSILPLATKVRKDLLMKNSKPWSEYSVALEHGYLDDFSYKTELSGHHAIFSAWILDYFQTMDITISNIGCGNRRVINFLDMKKIKKYYGYDLNNHCLLKAEKIYKSLNNVEFIHFDIDESNLVNKTDVVYIDSTLTMVENPYEILYKLLNISNCIFLNRTSLYKSEEKMTHRWSGMEEDSTNWKFSKKNMKKFAKKNKLELILVSSNSFALVKVDK